MILCLILRVNQLKKQIKKLKNEKSPANDPMNPVTSATVSLKDMDSMLQLFRTAAH